MAVLCLHVKLAFYDMHERLLNSKLDITPMPVIKATHIKRDNTKFSSTAEFYSGLNGVCFKSACPVDFLTPVL